MDAHRHIHVDCCAPEFIVVVAGIHAPGGKSVERNPFESNAPAVFHLGDCVFHASLRDQTEANQAVRRHRAVFLAQPVVVSPHNRFVSLVVFYAAPEVRSLAAGIQHFRLNTVDVLFMQSLLGRAGSGVFAESSAEWIDAPLSGYTNRLDHDASSLDNVSVAAAGQAQAARRAILIFLRHAVDPSIGRDLQMRIS